MSRTSRPKSPPETFADSGERAFHRWLFRARPSSDHALGGLGDDCASWVPPGRGSVLLTVDSLVEGRHFPSEAPPRLVGRYAAEASLSDLACKGARPVGLLLSLVLSPPTAVAWGKGVVQGARASLRRHGAWLVGGDTKAGPGRTVVSLGLGYAPRRRVPPRSGARPGDILATTGTVGRGSAAWITYSHGLRSRWEALERLLSVRARVREGEALAPLCHATLDTSDGLLAAARLLAEASGCSVEIWEASLPYDPGVRHLARRTGRPPADLAFFGGDYEILAAIPATNFQRAQAAVRRVGGTLSPIGRVTSRGPSVLMAGEVRTPLPDVGWDSFRPPQELDILRKPARPRGRRKDNNGRP